MQVVFVNVQARPILDPIALRGSRRRLDRVVKAVTADLDGPFMVSVHDRGQPLVCHEDVLRIRPEAIPKGLKRRERMEWEARLWRNTIVTKDQTILVTVLPQGGGQGGAGKIAITLASIALMAFAGPLAGLILGGGANPFALAALQAGIAIGGRADLISLEP